MAEILIQRKRRRSVWPWLLSLLVLALLPLPFIGREQSDETRLATAQRDTAARPDTAALRDSAMAHGDSAVVADAARRAAASSSPSTTAGRAPGGQPTATERTTATAAGAIAPAERIPVPSSTASGASSTPTGAAAVASSRGGSFRDFIATIAPTSERAHREYTAEAFDRLANDLRALGATEAGVSIIRVHADSLRLTSARSGARSDWTRAAFLGAVRELDLLRGRQRARVDIARLRSTAWSVDPRRSLLSQRATIDRFFAAARDALDSLSRRG